MPTYEYACRSCAEHLEVVQSFSDAPLTECPSCGGPLRKVFHPIGVAFKGSGFYKTDSRKATAASSSTAKSDTSASKSDTTSGSSSDGGDSGSKSAPAPAKSSDSSSSSSSSGSTSGSSEKSAAAS